MREGRRREVGLGDRTDRFLPAPELLLKVRAQTSSSWNSCTVNRRFDYIFDASFFGKPI